MADREVKPLEKTSSALPDEKIRESTKRVKKVTAFALRASAHKERRGPGRTAEERQKGKKKKAVRREGKKKKGRVLS